MPLLAPNPGDGSGHIERFVLLLYETTVVVLLNSLPASGYLYRQPLSGKDQLHENNHGLNKRICITPQGRNFRGAET